nr:hypothetical protein [Tanacetum cinerariifolium]
MSSLFANTHNVVAILEKSDAAKGFEQIIDFLSGSYIHYALTVNPHIYISCIKQFWNTASVKRSDDVTRLQALVYRKKIMISEDVIREILQLNDAEGIVCLPNEEIFAGLAQMGYKKPSTKLTFYKAFFSSQWKFLIHTLLQSLRAKRTSWNKFSTTMASAVICLSKGQKFNFSKYIFDSLVRNVDSSSKFYMYPRFIQLIIQNQVGDLSTHTTRRIKSSNDMEDVFNQGRMIDDLDKDKGIELVVDQAKDADIAETEGRHAVEQAEKQAEIYHLDLDHPSKVLSMQEDDSEVQKVVEVVTTAKLITDVVTAASQVSAASATIYATKPSILAAAPTVVAAYTRRRKGVIIKDLEEELSSKTPAETPKLKDKGKDILVETPKPMKKKDQIELDAEYARKFDENIRFLFKSREEIDEEDQEVLKSINKTPAHKAAKRRKLNEEAQEAEDLKKRLEVVDDEDDDVFIEATPLVRKASDFDNPSFPRPPQEPPNDEIDFELDAGNEISVVMNDNDELQCLDPRYEIDVSTNDENDDYFPFMFVIRIFLPYLIYPKVFPFLLSAESEDTIFDPGIFV